MGDLSKIAKAKRELEELYSGIPDDSVNLTFQDLAEVKQQKAHPSLDKKNSLSLNPIIESSPRKEEVAPLAKLPSLDFSRGLEATARSDHHRFHYQSHHFPHMHDHISHSRNTYNSPMNNHDHQVGVAMHGHHGMMHHNKNIVYDDDMSQMSGMTMASMSGYPERGGRRRPGIPHSNICTVCTTYIYIFRHRCLVCGRVYCRQCVGMGMGEMSEGRKCIECLGRRFSQRYIQKAGQVGCCTGYPSIVKQQELKWAEKGPRGSGENRYGGRSGIGSSRSRSPIPVRPSNRHAAHNNPPSFISNAPSPSVMGSPYSPYYSPTNHPLPF